MNTYQSEQDGQKQATQEEKPKIRHMSIVEIQEIFPQLPIRNTRLPSEYPHD